MRTQRSRRIFVQLKSLFLVTTAGFTILWMVDFRFRDEPTLFFVVRHADRVDNQDALTEAGKARAQQLKSVLGPLRIKTIYSTDFIRTKETVQPLAESLSLAPVLYDKVSDDFLRKVKSEHLGQSVLIVGHSNTIGKIVMGLGAELEPAIGEKEFDRLFIVAIQNGKTAVIPLRYGE